MEKIYRQKADMWSLSCDKSHVLHDTRKSGHVAEIRQITVAAADLEYWEELPAGAISPYTEDEYKRKVAELIHQRYDFDAEIALLNNMRVAEPTEKHRAEYAEYQAFREQCKQRAKDPALYL